MRSLRLVALAALAALAFSGPALAATLDFTGELGAAIAAGDREVVTYSGNADFGTVTFDANPRGSDITWGAGTGLGVDCRGGSTYCRVDAGDQIDWPEVLEISFEAPIFLTSIDISQLSTTNLALGPFRIRIEDAGSISGEGFDIFFSADDADEHGRLNVAINALASSISIIPVEGLFEDFSIARIHMSDVPAPAPGSPIPEPSSVLLMLAGGAIVLNQVRKRS